MRTVTMLEAHKLTMDTDGIIAMVLVVLALCAVALWSKSFPFSHVDYVVFGLAWLIFAFVIADHIVRVALDPKHSFRLVKVVVR